MKILVTGINGFVGRHLVNELLANGHDVWGIDTETTHPKTLSIDLMDANALADGLHSVAPDYVMHLAGIAKVHHKNKSLVYDINFKGTLNLLNACVLNGNLPRFVFISSSQVYGNVPQELQPIDESFPVSPINHYGASKAAGEILLRSFTNEYGLEYVVFRPFNHTGPGQSNSFVVPKIVNAFRSGEQSLMLGNVHTMRDFTDVRDVVKAYAGILNKFVSGEVYNVASGRSITIEGVIERLRTITGKKICIRKEEVLVRKNEIDTLLGDAGKLKSHIGWEPRFTLDDTLKAMLEE